MHCRFMIRGGWEQVIDVKEPLPSHYLTREVPVLSAFPDPIAELPKLVERQFVIKQFRSPRKEDEIVYLATDLEPELPIDWVPPAHECAALARANARIDELEQLCVRACSVLRVTEYPLAVTMILAGGRGAQRDLEEIESLQEALNSVAEKVKERDSEGHRAREMLSVR